MANNWAIVVGINEYKFLPNAPLKFAVADALAMRSFLCEEAGFKSGNVLFCGDGTTEATRSTLRDILLHQIQRAKGADNLWFFFSGHGIADHLMTIDGNPRDLKETAISINFVTDCLRDCRAKNIVLVLDMCRNENHDTAQKNMEPIEASLRSLVKEREGQQGIVTLFSCSRGESSYEIAEYGHGAFTYALLEGLRSQTIVKDLESHLARRVPELHERAGKVRKQVPLLIPEPGWKYDQPIFSHYATEKDVSQLKEMAIDAESDGEFDRALQFWEQVNLSAMKTEDRRRSLNRIDNLRNRLNAIVKPITLNTSEVPPSKGDLVVLKSETKTIEPKSDHHPIVDPIPRSLLKSDRRLGLESFEFVTFKVNKQGNVINRSNKTAQYFRQDLGSGVFIDMVAILGGQFRNIQIPEFFMSKTLITQLQWEAVLKLPKIRIELESNPSRFKGLKHPVERVNWWMAEEFCKRLSIAAKRNYQLPAEAQWEYACRSGTTTDYYFGDTLSPEVANYGRLTKKTTEVEKYPANDWGLYDMHGNLWEWCADHRSSNFGTALIDSSPITSSNENANRVLRGGSWAIDPQVCASSYRSYGSPALVSFVVVSGVGFRVACSSPRT